MSDVLRVERSDGVALVTLDRPESLNALSRELVARIAACFRELAEDDSVGAAVLTGAGRAFSAGVDLKELGFQGLGGAEEKRPADSLPDAIAAFDRPLIGAINGFAITGGFELALMCDLLIGSPEARFADTHARVGIVPGWGLSQRLSRWIGIGRAKELSFTGNYLDAERALAWGLLNRVVPADELVPAALALAKETCSCDPAVVKEIKRLIDTGYAGTLEAGLQLEAEASAAHMKRVTRDGVAARREAVLERGREQAS